MTSNRPGIPKKLDVHFSDSMMAVESNRARSMVSKKAATPPVNETALRAAFDALSERQIDILRLQSSGLTVPEISERLSLSQATVRQYISRIRKYLNSTGIYDHDGDRLPIKLVDFMYSNSKYSDVNDIFKQKRQYRREHQRPRPELPANAEENRTKKKITLRFEEAVINAVDERVSSLRKQGISVDRNSWIEEAIQLRLKI